VYPASIVLKNTYRLSLAEVSPRAQGSEIASRATNSNIYPMVYRAHTVKFNSLLAPIGVVAACTQKFVEGACYDFIVNAKRCRQASTSGNPMGITILCLHTTSEFKHGHNDLSEKFMILALLLTPSLADLN
jgi:hypothetical protein